MENYGFIVSKVRENPRVVGCRNCGLPIVRQESRIVIELPFGTDNGMNLHLKCATGFAVGIIKEVGH